MKWLRDHSARQNAGSSATAAGSMASGVNGCLRLEVSAQTMLRLLANGQLRAADFRCLDCESKQCVWRLLLMSCKKTLNAESDCNCKGNCSECGGSRNGANKKLELPVLMVKNSYQQIRIHGSPRPLLTKQEEDPNEQKHR